MPDTTNPEAEYEAIRLQVEDLLNTETRTPIAIHLGANQRASLEAYVKQVSGQADVGPLLSFRGLQVRSSKKADHLALMWAEGDDADPPDAPPPIPPAPAAVEAAPAPETPPAAPSAV
jgi:hypothetical protein